MADNPAHRPKISGDGVALVKEGGIEDGCGNEERVHGRIVFCIGSDGRHSPPQPDLVVLHVQLSTRAGLAG